MKFQGLVDKRNIHLLLGVYCNNPKLLRDEKYSTTVYDYPDEFHKKVFGAILNIAKKTGVSKITAVEIENEMSLFETSLALWNSRNGFQWIESAIEETQDKVHNVDLYRDNVRKYSLIRNAQNELGMDISFIYEEYNDLDTSDFRLSEKKAKMEKFNSMTSREVLKLINDRFVNFKSLWTDGFSDNYSFHIGSSAKERLEEHRNQSDAWGYPFQSGYMTTIFRGMRGKKFMIRSSISGGGKSRNSMADAANIACDKIYSWSLKKWISTGEKQPVLFISTELQREEIQDCLLAHISGIDEDRIATRDNITEEEDKILDESVEVMESSLLYGEYMPDFTIDSISEKIEEYVLNHGITHAFFDYINDSPSLYSYYIEKTGVRLQTHQILFLFSQSLKNIANKYNVYLGSATQLSANWKDEKDANALKGSKAIIEKADYGVISLPATPQDLKQLDPILKKGFYTIPNYCYHIFKNRGGKWKDIVVWTSLNLGTMRESDCFVTTKEYELISDIEKTLLEFETEQVIGSSFDEVDNVDVNEYITELKNTTL